MTTSENETHTQEERAADGSPAGIEEEVITPFPFDAEKISISNQVLSIEALIRRLNQGTVYPPCIQRRGNLWDDGQQSRLVESMMLCIPLPLFYVAADDEDNWNVVDGLQRLTCIDRYIRNQEFALTGLEFMHEYEGKKFNALPQKMQNRIFEIQLSMAIINPSTPSEVQCNVFKHLNTGVLPLSAQEIRHVLYYGFSATLLEELVESEWFKKATDHRVNDSRMSGREMILRFLAFFLRKDQYLKNEDMDSFLSETMQLLNLMPEGLPKDKLQKVFGGKCFVDQSLDLRALTLLSGLNSFGKSSVIQALRLLQSQKPLPDHGPLDDLVSVHAQEFSLTVHETVGSSPCPILRIRAW